MIRQSYVELLAHHQKHLIIMMMMTKKATTNTDHSSAMASVQERMNDFCKTCNHSNDSSIKVQHATFCTTYHHLSDSWKQAQHSHISAHARMNDKLVHSSMTVHCVPVHCHVTKRTQHCISITHTHLLLQFILVNLQHCGERAVQ